MLRRATFLLCSVTLRNGTVLKGTLNPGNRQMLLEGVAILPDGRVYSGTFDKERGFPLPGSQLEDDGDLYKGSFNDQWQRDGTGEAWLMDGTHYKGLFKGEDLVEGTVRIPNGTSEIVFTGVLKDEMFVRGTLKDQDFTYEGEFRDNQPHGKGKIVFATGAVQEGTFFNGKLHGPGCRMRLDSGFLYVGDFLDGHVRSGTLYTPTYTYEGEFNEHGRAHGEGSQTYLINEPRLTFTGIWENGAMLRGACVDEYGSPVDWQNDHALQSAVLGDSLQDNGNLNVAVNSYCDAKLKEAETLHKEMNKSFVEDAQNVLKATGSYPTKLELGYEGGLQVENEALAQSQQKQMRDMDNMKNAFEEQAGEYVAVADQLKGNVIGEINENMAKIHFTRQKGANQLASERVDEQFERFLKTFDRPQQGESDKGSPLNIKGNAPWKSFVPPSS